MTTHRRETTKKTKKRKNKRSLFDKRYVRKERRKSHNWGLVLIGSVLMFFCFQRYVIGVGIVSDRSMRPTLREGEYYLINNYIYHFTPPKRGDIVVFHPHKFSPDEYVKRVIGLEGETLLINSGNVYINGEKLAEPYAAGRTYPNSGPFSIPKDSVYVLGDNRIESEDSRGFGPVRLRNIRGKIRPGEWFPLR